MFRGEFRPLEADREFENKFREWSVSRDRFLSGLEKEIPEVVAQGWQKDYMQAAKDKKPLAHPFANEISCTGQKRRDGNHDDSANT